MHRSTTTRFSLLLPLLAFHALPNEAASQCTWGPLGTGTNGPIYATLEFEDSQGKGLIAAGSFWSAGGQSANNIARWDGTTWSPLHWGVDSSARALLLHDDGTGEQLYVGGMFFSAGGNSAAANLARWNGTTWSALPSTVNGPVYSLCAHDDGSGPALFVSGDFLQAGVASASRVARWNGSTWAPLGAGLNSRAWAMASFDEGSGSNLWVGGDFSTAGGQPAKLVARWDGAQWHPMANDLGGSSVNALKVFDDGSGPALYAAGSVKLDPQDVVNRYVLRRRNQQWETVGAAFDNVIYALEVFEGQGPARLHVAGAFLNIGSASIPWVARLEGSQWTSLGQSSTQQLFTTPFSLGTYRPSGAATLVLGGAFTSFNGQPANRIVALNCPLPAPVEPIPGCFANTANLTLASGTPQLGSAVTVSVACSFPLGAAVLYLGAPLLDASGCGVFLPGLGELLLQPNAIALGTKYFLGTAVNFTLGIPAQPGLAGSSAYLQSLCVSGLAPHPAELSSGLRLTVQP